MAEAKEKTAEKKEEKTEIKLSKKAEEVIKAVEVMTVLELNDLVKALEKKFGVSATLPLGAIPTAAPAGTAEGKTAAEEKTTFDVVLQSFGENKISVIKTVREINQNLGLKEAKDLVEAAPKPIVTGVKKEAAEEAKKKLEAAGAKVELK